MARIKLGFCTQHEMKYMYFGACTVFDFACMCVMLFAAVLFGCVCAAGFTPNMVHEEKMHVLVFF